MQTISTLLPLQRIRTWIVIVTFGCVTLSLGAGIVQAVGVTPAILDLQLQPGEVVQRTVTVVNTEDVPRTFQFLRENFSPSEEPGVPLFDGGAGDDFPSWISVEPSLVTIPPQGTMDVVLTIAVPVGAPRGDAYGVVFIAPTPEYQASARTAMLLFLSVLGDATYDINMVSLDLQKSWSSSLQNAASIRLQNAGNVYVKPEGLITLDPFLGRTREISANPKELRVLSGESRTWDVVWGEVEVSGVIASLVREWRAFALGPVRVTASLGVPSQETIHEEMTATFIVIPWRTGLLLGAMLVLGFVLLPKRST